MAPPHPSSQPQQPPSSGDLFLRVAAGIFSDLLTLDDLLQTIMVRVIEVTHATKGFLILLGPTGEPEFKVARNMKREDVENPRNRISMNLIKRVVESGQSVLTGDAKQDPRFDHAESVHNLLLKSILCVPLKDERRVLGTIYLENHITAGVFDDKSLEIVARVAEQASQALAMARTLESLKGERDRLELENRGLREIFRTEFEFGRFVGRSPAMLEVAQRITKVAASRHTVLVRGESGTGKELVARMLHATGPFRDKPFVAVNCAAVPGSLFESELFGHVKGAFTGAERTRVGKVEAAEGGTLFLDEVGDLPIDIQPKLLRLLQERTYERVGENDTRRADIRVIAATNKDLLAQVQTGRFREDLYYRLNLLPILLPSLRERPEDIAELAEHFLRCEGRQVAGFTSEALDFIRGYPWPGNVRELRNVVLRAAVYTTDGEPIGLEIIRGQLDEVDSKLLRKAQVVEVAVSIGTPHDEAMARFEASYLREMMRMHAGISRQDLAKKLGMSRRTLFQRLRDLGITRGDGDED